jgi:uncharacterized alkaline shock family protein YloU
MPLEQKAEQGRITINENVIARIAGAAAMEVFGLVGMSSRQQLKDGFAELLGRENYTRGIEVRIENGEVDVDLHIIVSYGTKISEVAHNVQERVKYTLNEIAGISANRINIYVQGVRV